MKGHELTITMNVQLQELNYQDLKTNLFDIQSSENQENLIKKIQSCVDLELLNYEQAEILIISLKLNQLIDKTEHYKKVKFRFYFKNKAMEYQVTGITIMILTFAEDSLFKGSLEDACEFLNKTNKYIILPEES